MRRPRPVGGGRWVRRASSARSAWPIVPSRSPARSASAARYTATWAGRRARFSWSNTIGGGAGGSSRASTSSRRRSTSGGITGRHARPDQVDGEHRAVAEDVVGERLEPASQRRLLAGLVHLRRRELDEARRHGRRPRRPARGAIASVRSPCVVVPGAGAPVQLGDRARAPRPGGGPGARRRTGGGSGTRRGDRRAGRGTGWCGRGARGSTARSPARSPRRTGPR